MEAASTPPCPPPPCSAVRGRLLRSVVRQRRHSLAQALPRKRSCCSVTCDPCRSTETWSFGLGRSLAAEAVSVGVLMILYGQRSRRSPAVRQHLRSLPASFYLAVLRLRRRLLGADRQPAVDPRPVDSPRCSGFEQHYDSRCLQAHLHRRFQRLRAGAGAARPRWQPCPAVQWTRSLLLRRSIVPALLHDLSADNNSDPEAASPTGALLVPVPVELNLSNQA